MYYLILPSQQSYVLHTIIITVLHMGKFRFRQVSVYECMCLDMGMDSRGMCVCGCMLNCLAKLASDTFSFLFKLVQYNEN